MQVKLIYRSFRFHNLVHPKNPANPDSDEHLPPLTTDD